MITCDMTTCDVTTWDDYMRYDYMRWLHAIWLHEVTTCDVTTWDDYMRYDYMRWLHAIWLHEMTTCDMTTWDDYMQYCDARWWHDMRRFCNDVMPFVDYSICIRGRPFDILGGFEDWWRVIIFFPTCLPENYFFLLRLCWQLFFSLLFWDIRIFFYVNVEHLHLLPQFSVWFWHTVIERVKRCSMTHILYLENYIFHTCLIFN